MAGYNGYTTQDLIDNITLTGHVPVGNLTFSPENLVTLANRELSTPIIKQILSTRGGYYLTHVDYEGRQDGLYDIPPDSVAGALYNVELVQDTTVIQVNPVEPSELCTTDSPTTTTYGFYLIGNKIQILPTPPVGSLRLWFYKRTSKLVPVSAAAKINNVDDTGGVLLVDSIPDNFGVGDTVDVVGNEPPFNILGTSVISDITGMQITLEDPPLDENDQTYAILEVSSILYTASNDGASGNDITIQYVDGAVLGMEFVTVVGTAITVTISDGMSLASNILAAFQASVPALLLVSPALVGADVAQNIYGPTNLVGGANLTVSSGNYICLNDQTCIPQIPVEYRMILEQRVIVSIYEIQGNKEKLAAAVAKLKELEADTMSLINNRVKSKTKIINPANGGFLSGRWARLANFSAGPLR